MRASPLALMLLLCCPLAGLAQDTRGSLNGIFVDSAGAPIAAVAVTVSGPAVQGDRAAASSRDGSFLIPALPVGRYTASGTRTSC